MSAHEAIAAGWESDARGGYDLKLGFVSLYIWHNAKSGRFCWSDMGLALLVFGESDTLEAAKVDAVAALIEALRPMAQLMASVLKEET